MKCEIGLGEMDGQQWRLNFKESPDASGRLSIYLHANGWLRMRSKIELTTVRRLRDVCNAILGENRAAITKALPTNTTEEA